MLKLSQSILKKTHYIRHYTRQYIRLQEKKKREKKKKVKSKKKKTTKKDINVISKIISSAIVLSVKDLYQLKQIKMSYIYNKIVEFDWFFLRTGLIVM